MRVFLRLSLIVVGVFVLNTMGCMCGPITGGGDGGLLPDGGMAGGGTGNGGGTGTGGGTGNGGGVGVNPDASCAQVSSQASLGKQPVDIIFVIDNSQSMTKEIEGVQDNINTNFAAIIGDAGIDYRVIMLSMHGSAADEQSICISKPLSGAATCTPPSLTGPTNSDRFFQYSLEIKSNDSFQKILGSYANPGFAYRDIFNVTSTAGWSPWLRTNAFKTFIEITDDNQNGMTYQEFDQKLLALTPKNFGSAASRNYRFHSIIGIPEKTPASNPYLPTEPMVTTGRCPSAYADVDETYQGLSILTGGLRFPVCTPDLYDAVFRTVAEGVVGSAQVSCEFAVPTPPVGSTLSNRIGVDYTPGGVGAVQHFTQVVNAAACAGATFYLDTAAAKVILCPDACAIVKGDPSAKVEVLFTCQPFIN
jgi:hypothetical protein